MAVTFTLDPIIDRACDLVKEKLSLAEMTDAYKHSAVHFFDLWDMAENLARMERLARGIDDFALSPLDVRPYKQ